MRRAIAWTAGKIGAVFFRVARAASRTPRQERFEAWARDQGDRTLRLEYDLREDSVVFDLGGYEGQWASDIFGRYACFIRIFEPVPRFAERIASRFARNPKITLHRFGLAGEARRAVITVDAERSSIFEAADADPGRGDRVAIDLVRAADFFRDQRIDRVDLMKVNIEGGEYDLLEHLIDSGLIRRLRDLQVQFHDFIPDAPRRMAAIQRRLAETHFLGWQYPFVWESWRARSWPLLPPSEPSGAQTGGDDVLR